MSYVPRKTAVLFTTKELGLVANLLKNHVQVAQYEPDSEQAQLSVKLERLFEIAEELEPLDTGS